MKYFMRVMMVSTMAAALFGPYSAHAETIAVFTKNVTNPFQQAVRFGSNAAAKALDIKIIHFYPNVPDSVPEQSKLIGDALDAKPDALVLDPVDIVAMAPAVEKANAAGIPVTNIEDRMAQGKFIAYVGADDSRIALETARYLLNAMGRRGNVVMLEGIPANPTSIERMKGFNDALKEFPDVKLLASKSAAYQRRTGQDVMDGFLKSFPQIDGVLAANDPMAFGALEALDRTKRKALLASINGSKEAVDLIRDGRLLASGEFNGFVLGCVGTELAARNLRKQPTPNEIIVKPAIIDKTNYQQYELPFAQRQCPNFDGMTKN
jgi:ribose transport system substrate-binding protein